MISNKISEGVKTRILMDIKRYREVGIWFEWNPIGGVSLSFLCDVDGEVDRTLKK